MKKIYPLILSLIFFASAFLSCGEDKRKAQIFRDVETTIEEYPDSAMSLLESIDTLRLDMGEARAKYALLMAEARYKNQIDDTTFSVLQPAIDYYITQGKGLGNERLRTYYYQGTIHRIAKRLPETSDCFSKGLALIESGEANDTLFWARLLLDYANSYFQLYDFQHCIESSLRASELFADIHRTDQQIKALEYAYGISCVSKNQPLADSIRAIFVEEADTVTWKLKALYRNDMAYAHCFGTKEDSKRVLDKFLSMGNLEGEELHYAAIGYMDAGEPEKSLELLEQVLANDTTLANTIKYLSAYAHSLKRAGRYEEAFEAMRRFANEYYNLTERKFTDELERMEQFHQLTLDKLRQEQQSRLAWTIGLSIACVLMLIILIIYHRMRIKSAELTALKAMLSQLEDERDNLQQLISSLQESQVDDETIRIIRERFELINTFFAAEIGDSETFNRKGAKLVESLTRDKQQFMNSLRIAYSASHPQFIRHLQSCGLTQWEINYCCLYLIGLRGKEIGTYLQMRSHYNHSSEIRAKLGLDEKGTNLGIYLRKLLEGGED